MAGVSLKGVNLASEEDKVTIKEEISSVEDMYTVYIKEEDEKMENTEIKGYCLKSASN